MRVGIEKEMRHRGGERKKRQYEGMTAPFSALIGWSFVCIVWHRKTGGVLGKGLAPSPGDPRKGGHELSNE